VAQTQQPHNHRRIEGAGFLLALDGNKTAGLRSQQMMRIRMGAVMRKAKIVAVLAMALLIAACDRPMTTPEKGAVVGGALGTGIGLVAGGSFGAVVGAGLIGGAVGYLGGTAVQNSR